MKIILIFSVLFFIIWNIFKFLFKSKNPLKEIWFWITFVILSFGIILFGIYLFFRAIGGPVPKEGWTRKYFENGKLESEFFIKNGAVDGYSKSWYPSGQLEIQSKYKNGDQVDTNLIYYETGKIQLIEIIKSKKTIKRILYFPDGAIQSEYYNPIAKNENNYRIDYYSNGNKKFETKINNDSFEGIGIYYFQNGKIKYKGEYKRGQKNGVWLKFDSLTNTVIERDSFDFNKPKPFKSSWN